MKVPFIGRSGRRPVIVVAPHGGKRARPIRRGDRINDLHTAEIAGELAERLDAHTLINDNCDRNDIDLNRIAELTSEAAAFLQALREDALRGGGQGQRVPVVQWSFPGARRRGCGRALAVCVGGRR